MFYHALFGSRPDPGAKRGPANIQSKTQGFFVEPDLGRSHLVEPTVHSVNAIHSGKMYTPEAIRRGLAKCLTLVYRPAFGHLGAFFKDFARFFRSACFLERNTNHHVGCGIGGVIVD